ncbi:hypothetical protein DB346_15840 [Verrucomicrobia bacterium LW23]|nr:hypothetical protein DB346_15840 [Verrucomicrobia bacterium LW23]
MKSTSFSLCLAFASVFSIVALIPGMAPPNAVARPEPVPPLPAARKAREATHTHRPAPVYAIPVPGTGGWRINPNRREKDRVSEREWFDRLPATTPGRLLPGDILLKKVYDGHATNEVVQGQTPFHSTHGTRRTGHALIYLGAGHVAEASMTRGGLWQDKLSSRKGQTLLVYRRVGPGADEARRRAVEFARACSPYAWDEKLASAAASGNTRAQARMAARRPVITYALDHALLTFPATTWFDADARRRAGMAAQLQAPSASMMCSEFVTYCYQATPRPSLPIDAEATAPIYLEDALNRSELFVCVGALRP